MLQSNKKLSVTLELVKTAKIKHKKGLSTTASIRASCFAVSVDINCAHALCGHRKTQPNLFFFYIMLGCITLVENVISAHNEGEHMANIYFIFCCVTKEQYATIGLALAKVCFA